MLCKRERKKLIRSMLQSDEQAKREGLAIALLRQYTNYKTHTSILNPKRVHNFDGCIDVEIMKAKQFRELCNR